MGASPGLFNRYIATLDGKIVYLEGPLFIDVFQQPKLRLNGVSIGIKLWPSLDAFRLISDSIRSGGEDCGRLFQTLCPTFRLRTHRTNERLIQMQAAIYPYLRTEIKTTSIASGQYSFSSNDIFQGLVPNKLIVGLVSSAAYMEDYSIIPFYFKHYDCSSVSFYVDGQSYPSQPLQLNYEADQYVGCYRTLTTFRNDVNVDRYDYKEGHCFYVLEVDPYYSFNIKRKGHCRLELKFTEPLPESVTLTLNANFPEILNIEQSRSVFVR